MHPIEICIVNIFMKGIRYFINFFSFQNAILKFVVSITTFTDGLFNNNHSRWWFKIYRRRNSHDDNKIYWLNLLHCSLMYVSYNKPCQLCFLTLFRYLYLRPYFWSQSPNRLLQTDDWIWCRFAQFVYKSDLRPNRLLLLGESNRLLEIV